MTRCFRFIHRPANADGIATAMGYSLGGFLLRQAGYDSMGGTVLCVGIVVGVGYFAFSAVALAALLNAAGRKAE